MSTLGNNDAVLFPYPGLRPFRHDEADLFFGREEQVDQLLARLESCRFLAVVGRSGCGKSSLIRAGLLPALRPMREPSVTPRAARDLEVWSVRSAS